VSKERVAIIVTAVAAAGQILVAGGARAGGPAPPAELTAPGRDVGGVRVAVDPSGVAVAAWIARSAQRESVIELAERPSATGSWSAPTEVSARGRSFDLPRLALRRGGGVALWQRFDGSWRLEGAYRSGRWAAAEQVAGGMPTPAGAVAVTVDPSGNAVAAWIDGSRAVRASVRRSGSWSPPATLAPATTAARHSIRVVVDGSGAATALWATGGDGWRVEAARRPRDGSWSGPAPVASTASTIPMLDAAADAAGNVTVVWAQRHETVDEVVETAAWSAASQRWSAPAEISAHSETIRDVHVAVTSAGAAVAAWSARTSGETVVQAATRPSAAARWLRAVVLSRRAANLTEPRLALDERGTAVVVWSSETLPARIEATFRPVGSPRWLPPVDVGTGRFPEVALGGGTGVVAWVDGVVKAASLDVRAAEAPAAFVRPFIVGRARPGAVVAARPGSWDGARPLRYAYRWLRRGKPVPGATAPTYRLRARDAGTTLAVRVTASNAAGTFSSTSRGVRVARR
jgi:hypothetical protein